MVTFFDGETLKTVDSRQDDFASNSPFTHVIYTVPADTWTKLIILKASKDLPLTSPLSIQIKYTSGETVIIHSGLEGGDFNGDGKIENEILLSTGDLIQLVRGSGPGDATTLTTEYMIREYENPS